MKRYLVVQTAFIGDAILTLPLIQVLKKVEPEALVDVVVIPRTSELFSTHPAVDRVIVFDKRGGDRGISGLWRIAKSVGEGRYEAALVPHRSLRSAFLARIGRVPVRIGFDRSAGWFLLTETIRYQPSWHEVERNLSLLGPLGIQWKDKELPTLFPGSIDIEKVDEFLAKSKFSDGAALAGIAPGSVWKTKRWLEDRYTELTKNLLAEGFSVALIGGREDGRLCQEIKVGAASPRVAVAAGELSLLQSAELIRRCRVLVSNDSAPMHLAVAMRTPVVAIFGATVPEFGFAPYGNNSAILGTKGLPCRPCSVHGGQRCPIKTFDCMVNISTEDVLNKVRDLIG